VVFTVVQNVMIYQDRNQQNVKPENTQPLREDFATVSLIVSTEKTKNIVHLVMAINRGNVKTRNNVLELNKDVTDGQTVMTVPMNVVVLILVAKNSVWVELYFPNSKKE
jgi:hypothetical protein